ncbi:MAG: lipopolysaccharide transport periplasmic protein LptA [Gammaproteobacteria bacterium]|nr:MAG: lipopolysaccharide transport periplasmic protein LptA [Gammaproteobacteria bacterium]
MTFTQSFNLDVRLLTILMLASAPATALELTGSAQPIHVQADKAQLDETRGQATYIGNVIITQGDSRLEADKVVLVRDEQGIARVEAYGQPAYLRQQNPDTPEPTEGWGEQLVYTRDSQTLDLLRQARLKQGTNSFQGNAIHYNTETRVVEAEYDEKTGTGRVEMIITPSTGRSTPQP